MDREAIIMPRVGMFADAHAFGLLIIPSPENVEPNSIFSLNYQ